MTTQFQTIGKILDLAATDGRLEDAVEELEKFAKLRSTTFFQYMEHCMEPADFFKEDGTEKSLDELYEQYKENSKAI